MTAARSNSTSQSEDLGSYDLTIKLHPEVEADISVLVYPTGMTPEEYAESLVPAEESEEDSAEPIEAQAAEEEIESEQEAIALPMPAPSWRGFLTG